MESKNNNTADLALHRRLSEMGVITKSNAEVLRKVAALFSEMRAAGDIPEEISVFALIEIPGQQADAIEQRHAAVSAIAKEARERLDGGIVHLFPDL